MKKNPAELKLHIPYETFYREALGEPSARTATSNIFFCPFHNDRKTPNFTVFNDGGFKCFSCNESGDVIAFYMKRQNVDFSTALHELAAKYAPAMLNGNGDCGKTKGNGEIVEEYNYRDAAGEVVFQVVRYEPKDFRQRRPDGTGGWIWNIKEVGLIPYQLPGILSSTGTVYITEGEKDAYRLVELGLIATTCAGGAGKWKPEFNQYLRDRDVIILEDNDEPGRKHGEKIASSLSGIARTLKVISFDELPLHGDVSDFLRNHSLEDLARKIEQTPAYRPVDFISEPSETPDDLSFTPTPQTPAPLAPEAFYGLAGEFVQTVAPHTEADPAALLIQLLVAFGSVVGRNPHFVVEADRHGVNLFACLVGATSKGRKGTSKGHVLKLLKSVDPQWASICNHNGLSTGEGLIWIVRDPIERQSPVKQGGRITEYQTEVIDPGIADKRAMVWETEFARTLQAMKRETNTLSTVVRLAFDGDTLKSMTKNSPYQATDPHVSIVGHITQDELKSLLCANEYSNGFANRFLWVFVQRANILPEGGQLHEIDLDPLIERLSDAVRFAKQVGKLERDDEARAIWLAVYAELSNGKPGLVGKVAARAEPLVMRIACIYALLDKSTMIKAAHLMAGLAVWTYCEKSAEHIFGDALGNRVADAIMQGLKDNPGGMTRTKISNLFGRNMGRGRIDEALEILVNAGTVKCAVEKSGGGRDIERWQAVRN